MPSPDQAVAASTTAAPPRLTRAEFAEIRRLAQEHFGLDLKDGKQGLVVARLGKTIQRRGFASFEQYCRHVAEDRTGAALVELADALTTNFTGFLREPAHFHFLQRVVCPAVAGRKRIDIWSAAASTGEEPYSILFTMLETLGPDADVRILATDISTKALQGVQDATYQADRIEPLPANWRQRYLLRGNGRWQGWYRVKPEYRSRITCRRFNLVTDPLPAAEFPVIFCRNVMIYFDKPTQANVVRRLSSTLEANGHFLIGHSESLAGVDHGLAYVEPAVYRRAGKDRHA